MEATETEVLPIAKNAWIIARRESVPEKTKLGLLIPNSARDEAAERRETCVGLVLSVGDGKNPMSGPDGTPPCEAGQRIMWSTYAERILIRDNDEGDLVAFPFKELIGVLAAE